MRDLVDPGVFRDAVNTTMERYPYLCVELQKTDGQCCFAQNPRSVVVANSPHGVELNSKESNYHMIAFSWWDDWIMLDAFHGMTDGAGAYEVIRTLLHYYCSKHYRVALSEEGIRLLGDEIPAEEWADPVAGRVSYVGKANFKDAEQYVRDFRLWTSPASNGLTIEMSAVNGRFILDFSQVFSSPLFVNAFLKELEENGITYDLQDVSDLELPNIKLPWTE